MRIHHPPKPLTHGEEAPRDGRRGEAGKHVISGREVGEVWAGHGLDAALAPHVHLAALGLGSGRVTGVAGGHFHHPEHSTRSECRYKEREERRVPLRCGVTVPGGERNMCQHVYLGTTSTLKRFCLEVFTYSFLFHLSDTQCCVHFRSAA